MISVDDAIDAISRNVDPLPSGSIPTASAFGRVLAGRVTAVHPVPLFDQSAVDGYAVRSVDLTASSTTLPVRCTIAAGAYPHSPSLDPGTAARIFTGALLPRGADTVVRQELVTVDGGSAVIEYPVPAGVDIRRRGEELVSGSPLADPGTRVTSGLIGALIAAGVHHVDVAAQPRVRVVVTGDEVVPAGAHLMRGQVPDCNGPTVTATLQQWGLGVSAAHAGDTRKEVQRAIEGALDDADVVITTGGVSVGELDLVPSVAESLGCERILWKVTQRPGKPLYVARRGSSTLIGLPGNPAAVLVNLHVFVRQVIDLCQGADSGRPWQWGVHDTQPVQLDEKTLWLRCISRIDHGGVVRLTALPKQGSHMLSNLAKANALARIPPRGSAPTRGPLSLWLPLDA